MIDFYYLRENFEKNYQCFQDRQDGKNNDESASNDHREKKGRPLGKKPKRINKNRIFECNMCGKKYTRQENLNYHHWSAHSGQLALHSCNFF